MAPLTQNQLVFRDRLAERTGLRKEVVGAWIFHEQNGSAAQGYEKRKYYNWLNVGRTDSGDTGDAAAHIWSDPVRAADETVKWIDTKAAPAIRNALKGARGKSAREQATAIANSPWASSHYGGPQGLIKLLDIGGQGSGGGRGETMADRGGSDSRDSSGRVQAGLDILNGSDAPVAVQAAVDTGPAKYQALSQLHNGGDIVNFATQIASLRQAAPQQQAEPQQTAFKAPEQGAEGTVPPAGASAGNAAGALDYARSKIGHFSENRGSNRGDELDALQARFGMTGQAWCAMFATMVASKGGMPRQGRSAAVAQVRQWAQAGTNGYEKGVRSVRDARPGDLVMFGNSHIGVVDSVGPDGLRTIEGNTSNGKVTTRNRGWTGDIARPRYGG